MDLWASERAWAFHNQPGKWCQDWQGTGGGHADLVPWADVGTSGKAALIGTETKDRFLGKTEKKLMMRIIPVEARGAPATGNNLKRWRSSQAGRRAHFTSLLCLSPPNL